MKVVGVDYLDAENVYTVYFSAPHRVDFRALVRDLARNLRARVELRQIGPRDEARAAGRHRPLRPRPVLRDLPQGLRAGLRPDGQGPGPAGQPAADRGGVRAADVLPEVRAPALPRRPQQDAPRRAEGRHPRGHRNRRGPQRALATPSWSAWTTVAAAARVRRPRCAPRASSTTRRTATRCGSPRANRKDDRSAVPAEVDVPSWRLGAGVGFDRSASPRVGPPCRIRV